MRHTSSSCARRASGARRSKCGRSLAGYTLCMAAAACAGGAKFESVASDGSFALRAACSSLPLPLASLMTAGSAGLPRPERSTAAATTLPYRRSLCPRSAWRLVPVVPLGGASGVGPIEEPSPVTLSTSARMGASRLSVPWACSAAVAPAVSRSSHPHRPVTYSCALCSTHHTIQAAGAHRASGTSGGRRPSSGSRPGRGPSCP